MSKTHTEIALAKGTGDIAITLDFENSDRHPHGFNIEVARVGDVSVSIDPAAQARKQDALETASLILAVTNEEDRMVAVTNVATLRAYVNGVEKSRKDVKQPFWDAGVAIDEIAKKEKAPVLEEITRVEKLLTGYQREQEKIAEAARQAEAERLRKEEAARQAQLAEEQRLREEAERKSREAEEAAKGKGKAAAMAADLARTKAALAVSQANELANQRRQQEEADKWSGGGSAPALPPNTQGTAVQKKWEIEVTDIEALYRQFGRRFVKMEVDMAALKYHLNGGVEPTSINGIKATQVTDVRVRAVK